MRVTLAENNKNAAFLRFYAAFKKVVIPSCKLSYIVIPFVLKSTTFCLIKIPHDCKVKI